MVDSFYEQRHMHRMTDKPYTLRDAATLMLLREAPDGFETLMLKRSEALAFGPGQWVYPGGAVDDSDIGATEIETLQNAAARETMEEANIVVSATELHRYFRISTPSGPKRFNTSFFVAAAPANCTVKIDGSEIVDYKWMRPIDVVEAYFAGLMGMMPPTTMSLMRAAMHTTLESVLKDFMTMPPMLLEHSISKQIDGMYVMYKGDCGFETADPTLEGPRNRNIFSMSKNIMFRYEHTADPTLYPEIDGGFAKKYPRG